MLFSRPARTLPFALGALTGAAAAALIARRVLRSAPPGPTPVGRAFDQVNAGFHEHYGEAKQMRAEDEPVFLVMGDELVLVRRGERHAATFTPRLFHVIKSVVHGPIALYALLHRHGEDAIDAAAHSRLASLRDRTASALEALDDETDDPTAVGHLRTVLVDSLAFLDRVLASGRATAADIDAFAGALGPALLRCTDDATRLQLDALHEHVTRALGRLDEREKETFHVVVTGDHQARARSLAMQYFQKLLGEEASDERRVAYAEGVADEDEALALVGTRRLDRTIARAFFGDERRLQRDVLGDAAHDRLASFPLPTLR